MLPSCYQPTGTNASYLGAGISVGVTNSGNPGDDGDADFGGNVQGRFAIPNTQFLLEVQSYSMMNQLPSCR